MNINFVLMEMTHLRYWIPLVIEGNKRGLQSVFYIGPSYKYNCPFHYTHVLDELSKEHNISLKKISNVGGCEGLLFSNEKTGIDQIKTAKKAKKIICTYQTDFIECYNLYIDAVDHVIMPSKNIAEYYNLHTEKNMYLGVPKYDISLSEEEILKKYNIPSSKKALIVYPKGRDQKAVDMARVIWSLENMGYTIMFKTRGKDPLAPAAVDAIRSHGHFYFEDTSWYPHTTQELLSVSDIVINFGSTTIEECVMYDVPLVNFDVKPAIRNGSKRPYRVTHDYLYNYDYCKQINTKFSEQELVAAINYLTTADLTSEFKKSREKHLFGHKDSCKKILDVLL